VKNSGSSTGKTVLILGATGGFGSALCKHMAQNGWQVRATSRATKLPDSSGNITWYAANLDDKQSLQKAANGADLVVHAVNVPYTKWDPLMINYTRDIIDLARNNQAHLLFIGNIYNAGIPDGGTIDEKTPSNPINKKGALRETLENMIAEAAQNGLRSTIMRFGDFFGPDIKGTNWFNEFTKSVSKNKLTVPGEMTVAHTWAYLPDAAAATEQVARRRVEHGHSPDHLIVPFRGHVFSLSDLKREIESVTGNELKTSLLPWKLFSLLGVVWPLMKDIISMRYLWQHDIQMDDSMLTNLLGRKFIGTTLRDAIIETVPGLVQK